MFRYKIFNFYLKNNSDEERINVSTLKNNSLYKIIAKKRTSTEVWFFATKKDGKIFNRPYRINRLCSLMLNPNYEQFFNRYGSTVYFRDDDDDYKLYRMKPMEFSYLTKLKSEEAKLFCQKIIENKVYFNF